MLVDRNVVIVRGVQKSGKTTLGRLLHENYVKSYLPSVFIEALPGVGDAVGYLIHHLRCHTLEIDVTPETLLSKRVLFIIDQAQNFYGHAGFWNDVIRPLAGSSLPLQICLLCSSLSSINSGTSLPFYVDNDHIVENTPMPCDDGTARRIGIFYTREEFDEVAEAERRQVFSLLSDGSKLEAAALHYVYNFTNGHPGAVEAVLPYVYSEHGIKKSSEGINGPRTITKTQVAEILANEAALLSFAMTCSVRESFPRPADLTAAVAALLGMAVKQGKYYYRSGTTEEGIRTCLSNGWLYRAAFHSEGMTECHFPSSLHKIYMKHFLERWKPPVGGS
ncbi:hypothetical protein VTO42DRAFT_5406 [Malbranchea cinnamomea]